MLRFFQPLQLNKPKNQSIKEHVMKTHALSAVIVASATFNAFASDGAYWTTVNGNIFRSATTGECVRSGSWTPEDAIEECEGKATKTAAPVATAVADSDGDGVADDLDKCPDSPADKPVDANGCTIVSVVLKNVHFESNSSELTAGSSVDLDKVVESMKQYDDLRIEVQAHTDNMGDAAYNQYLSEQRAESVRDYLVDKGIAADRMEVKGYGETQPIADNNAREGRAKNRRVELKIIE
jgi:outer membrane protein OmpA-like peptidoglycan-associated protein